MLKETARIKRLSEQMLYMAQSSQAGGSEVQLNVIIQKAFQRARTQTDNTLAELKIENQLESLASLTLEANPEALTHAFEELFLNSIQANPDAQIIQVEICQDLTGKRLVRLRDGGTGLTEDLVKQATEAFYTTRHTGVGLGLSVAQKVITEHQGELKLNSRTQERNWDIEIEFPSYRIHA